MYPYYVKIPLIRRLLYMFYSRLLNMAESHSSMDTTTPNINRNSKPAAKRSKNESTPLPAIDDEEYYIRRRLPRTLPRRKNDVYVTAKTKFACQIDRCRKLLNAGYSNLYIHGLGMAVDRAINLSLVLNHEYNNTLELSVHSSTVELTDDPVSPVSEDGSVTPEPPRTRANSAVHIRVSMPKLREDVTNKDKT